VSVNFRKIIFLLIFFFLISTFPFYAFGKDIAPLFNVDVNPISAGSVAEYHIYGSYSPYDRVNVMKLYFREDTSFKYPGAPSGSILVNGIKVLGTQFKEVVNEESVELTLYLSQYINAGNQIDILIKKEAGLVNPITPATCYKVRVLLCYNSVELGVILSNSYRISSSQVQELTANVYPSIKGMKAEYKVIFVTGVRGKLDSGSSYISVRFPEGTFFPSIMSQSGVLINGSNVAAVYKNANDPYVLQVYPSLEIPANYLVNLVFSSKLGITNTSKAGIYKISVSTSSEPDWVESEPFEIFEPEVQDLKVSLSPDSIALPSEVLVKFKTSQVGYLSKGSKIYVEFPFDFDLSSLNLNANFTINGENSVANSNGNIIEVSTPSSVSASSFVELKIPSNANVRNPLRAGEYTIRVWTDADNSTKPYVVNVKESFINDLRLEALYSGFGSANEFKIKFLTGPVYTMIKNVDLIIVQFDNGFLLPENISQGIVKVNNNIGSTVSRDGNKLYITVPIDIPPSSAVEVFIPQEFGIKNPYDIGEYGVKVSTSKEPTEVESNKIKITPLPVVEFTVNPSAPDGLNGYYKSNPEIMLSTSNGVKVFYKVDEGEFAEYKNSFKVSEGLHAVYAYAVDGVGNKGDIVKKELNIDTTPPEVKFDNLNSNPVFKGSPGKLTGTVSEPCTLKINEVILELNKENLNFIAELNVYEGMPIAIYVRDLAGNAKTMLLSAHIDSIPPAITYLNMPANLQSAGGSAGTIETTESSYAIQLKLNEKGKIYINNSEVSSIGDIFTYYASLSEGENLFTIKAVDVAGNETSQTLVIKKVNEKKIVLQIGVTTAILGGNTLELEAAPFIEKVGDKGFTLVPLRFISEAFGATVDWNEALKVISISYNSHSIQIQVGSTVAIVDGSIKTLDVAPKIVNGRTFVPIRFISETFGAKVDWDGTTKTITITYTP
jgi:hypothetical protein